MQTWYVVKRVDAGTYYRREEKGVLEFSPSPRAALMFGSVERAEYFIDTAQHCYSIDEPLEVVKIYTPGKPLVVKSEPAEGTGDTIILVLAALILGGVLCVCFYLEIHNNEFLHQLVKP